MKEEELSETDLNKIALYLLSGMHPIRKECTSGILRYWFKRREVEAILKTFTEPAMQPIQKFIHTLNSVRAEAVAMRRAQVK